MLEHSEDIFTGRNEVLAKVIFSEACVILSTGGGCAPNFRWGGCLLQIFGGVSAPNFGGGVCSKFSGGVSASNFRGMGGCLLQIFEGVSAPNFRGGLLQIFWGGLQFSEYDQRSAGTHPTGMHSFFSTKLKLTYFG